MTDQDNDNENERRVVQKTDEPNELYVQMKVVREVTLYGEPAREVWRIKAPYGSGSSDLLEIDVEVTHPMGGQTKFRHRDVDPLAAPPDVLQRAADAISDSFDRVTDARDGDL